MTKTNGLMLVLSAPSGTGKTTLARRLVEETPDAIFSVSATTRAPRGAELDGIDYTFHTPEEFQRLVDQDLLLEWAEVHGNRYGTPRRFAQEAIEGGKLVVFDIDVQGGTQIKGRHPEAATLFVLPPSLEELERRLRRRGTDDEAVIRRRLDAARSEIAAGLASYDYALVNDRFEQAYADLVALVRHLRGQGGPEEERVAERLRQTLRERRAAAG